MTPTPSRVDTSGSSLDIAKWVWRHLVPKSGAASSVQGELLRAIEKLRSEAQGNGNINWDEGFELFVTFLRAKLTSQHYLSAEDRQAIHRDLDRLVNFVTPAELADDHAADHQLPYVDDDLYDRLTDHMAEFCRRWPDVIPLDEDPRQYR
jgi:hypothetical protein